MHGWKGCDCAVGEGVREWTHADHDEEFKTVVFEC